MIKSLKYLVFPIILIAILSSFFILERERKKDAELAGMDQKKNRIIVSENKSDAEVSREEENLASKPIAQPVALSNKILIEVPFTAQVPFAKWDEYHEEACEEASLIMLKYYLNKKKLTPEIAEKEIQDIIRFEKKEYGDYRDSTAQEIVKLARDYYQIKNLKVVYDFKKEDVKKYLAQGNPIIVPAAGRLLGNPNFTPPGPLYHALILVGYDGDALIANDPGTRKGKNYRYNLDVLYNAIHDFPGKKEEIEKGRKAMIVLE